MTNSIAWNAPALRATRHPTPHRGAATARQGQGGPKNTVILSGVKRAQRAERSRRTPAELRGARIASLHFEGGSDGMILRRVETCLHPRLRRMILDLVDGRVRQCRNE
jgi:hypothetical protein